MTTIHVSHDNKKSLNQDIPVADLHTREEFTHDGYRQFLRNIKAAGYDFCDFRAGHERLRADPSERIIFLRHDIDFDMQAAADMARIEHEEGAMASYFFMLRTAHYNIFTPENMRSLEIIQSLGHAVGLHFDCAAYENLNTKGKIQYYCNREAQLLSSYTDRKIEVVSFHRPNELVLSSDADLTHPLLHSYASFFYKDIKYCSDSRGVWRYGHPLDTPDFKAGKPLHLLIHPVWWTKNPQMPLDALKAYADRKDDELRASMAANCIVFPYKGVNE